MPQVYLNREKRKLRVQHAKRSWSGDQVSLHLILNRQCQAGLEILPRRAYLVSHSLAEVHKARVLGLLDVEPGDSLLQLQDENVTLQG